MSGAKHFDVTDFANASGSLVLRRHFNSLAFAGAVTGAVSKPLGLANWLFDFQFELQIGASWNDLTGANGQVLLLTSTCDAPSFMTDNQKDTTLVPFTSVRAQYYNQAGYNNPQTDYTLSFVGAWPTTVTAQSTTWELTGPDDTVYMLKTFLSPISGKYDTARPVSITRRNGMTLTLAYGSMNQLTSITDNFGNVISFTWVYNPNDGTPMAISAAILPGGYSINYTYATIRTIGPTLNLPDVLTGVQYLDNTSTVRDATTYQYNSTSAPYAVTDIYDNTSPTPVHRWGVTYDSLGRALVSSLTGVSGAVQSYSVVYNTDPTPGVAGSFTRTVTNPLGDRGTADRGSRTTLGQRRDDRHHQLWLQCQRLSADHHQRPGPGDDSHVVGLARGAAERHRPQRRRHHLHLRYPRPPDLGHRQPGRLAIDLSVPVRRGG
jgi:hypothetical protein